MRQHRSYFGLQLKRAGRLLPQMLAVTLLLAALAAMAALMLSRLQDDDRSQTIIRIGVTGDEEEEILSDALELLKSVDSSRFSISLERMEEPEAARLLRSGQINAYFIIPDGFAEALWYGEHKPITYVSFSVGSDVGSQLARELVTSISSLVLETENAVYGAQDAVRERKPELDPYRAGNKLVYRYAAAILDRDRLFTLEQIEGEASLSVPAYYLCGLSLLFVMLWSISCAPLFSRRSRELGQVLGSDGFGAVGQVLSEFAAYLLLLLFALLAAGGLACVLLGRLGISIPELPEARSSLLSLAAGFLPPALMLCALQFLLYELANNTVSGILLQFLNAAVQGYLAGCFYPSSFFPEGLRRVGELLPAGVGMRYLGALLLARPDREAALWVWAYFALFLTLCLLVRRRRNRS